MALLAVSGFGAMQKQGEFTKLLELVLENRRYDDSPNPLPFEILEIGAGRGGTSWVWSKLGNLTTIDLPNGPWGGTELSSSFEYIKQNSPYEVRFFPGNSQDDEILEKARGRSYDFLFIDGAHDYAGVAADFERYRTVVRAGGIIALHDICLHPPETGCEVEKFWKEICASGEFETSEFISEPVSWGGIGIVRL